LRKPLEPLAGPNLRGIEAQRELLKLFPAFQFGANGPIAGLGDVLEALGDRDGWMQIAFLLHPNDNLDGDTPVDRMRSGDVSPAISAAWPSSELHPPVLTT
jgi:hypothetical protein